MVQLKKRQAVNASVMLNRGLEKAVIESRALFPSRRTCLEILFAPRRMNKPCRIILRSMPPKVW